MVWRITPGNLLVDDPDAITYLAAVETADGQPLESGVRLAVNAFVKGCKADGIWPAIKASCVLAGARTLNGALVPLTGAAPTNYNFVSGDYNRKTGLVGNGSSKYLNANRGGNSDPDNNAHLSIYISTASADVTRCYVGCQLGLNSGQYSGQNCLFNGTPSVAYPFRSRLSDFVASHEGTQDTSNSVGLMGWSRSLASSFVARSNKANQTISAPSSASTTLSYYLFARNMTNSPNSFSSGRLAFYSIGEALDLALLDARVTTLINALAAAIP